MPHSVSPSPTVCSRRAAAPPDRRDDVDGRGVDDEARSDEEDVARSPDARLEDDVLGRLLLDSGRAVLVVRLPLPLDSGRAVLVAPLLDSGRAVVAVRPLPDSLRAVLAVVDARGMRSA